MRILRALGLLLLLMLAAGFAAWIADQPGSFRILWLGYEILAPAPLIALLALLGLLAFAALVWMLAWAAALPERQRLKRERRGYAAFAAGMIAVAAGEPERAQALAKKAGGLLSEPSLPRLLQAHAAQLAGDRDASHRIYAQMTDDPATAYLGLRGLIGEAENKGDATEALRLAERASALRPASPFAAEAELRFRLAAGDWAGARARLDRAVARKALDRAAARGLSARLDFAEAWDAVLRGEHVAARKQALAAAKILPDHPAAAAILVRAADTPAEREQAAKKIQALWQKAPSRALLLLWRRLEALREPPLTPDQLRARLIGLAEAHPAAPESRLIRAEAALEARDFASARQLLQERSSQGWEPSGAWELELLSRLASIGDGDQMAADRYAARAAASSDRGEAWACKSCGAHHAEWQPLCSACSSFDGVQAQRLGVLPQAAINALPAPEAEAAAAAASGFWQRLLRRVR